MQGASQWCAVVAEGDIEQVGGSQALGKHGTSPVSRSVVAEERVFEPRLSSVLCKQGASQ